MVPIQIHRDCLYFTYESRSHAVSRVKKSDAPFASSFSNCGAVFNLHVETKSASILSRTGREPRSQEFESRRKSAIRALCEPFNLRVTALEFTSRLSRLKLSGNDIRRFGGICKSNFWFCWFFIKLLLVLFLHRSSFEPGGCDIVTDLAVDTDGKSNFI